MKNTKKRRISNILVTGGCGFIGSNFIRYLFSRDDFKGKIINLDLLTYAASPLNLSDIEKQHGKKRYLFTKGDICDSKLIEKIFSDYSIDTVVNFAAESHVDRSILGPAEFVRTNIQGTFNLLDTFRRYSAEKSGTLFHHVSTDEVYGSLGKSGEFFEDTPYDPRSPYSASKASSDHLVKAYHHTYELPVTISNCSNNYGPYQFPEKLIPLMICNMIQEKPLPVYGDGKNIRDWLYVTDHCEGIISVLTEGRCGETYNIGGETEKENIALVETLCEIMAEFSEKPIDYYKKLITFVPDRPGHDRRYAINCDKLKKETGWEQCHNFEAGLEKTVRWYLNSEKWLEKVMDKSYQKWIKSHYEKRQ